MAVTIKDIAKHAGVTHATVSRALNSSPLISAGTSERIRQIAADMGYQPSAAARSLKTNRSQVLGVVLRSIEDPFFSEVLQGIELGVQGSGYSLFISAANRDPEQKHEVVKAMVEHRVEGVIICSTSFSESQRGQLFNYGVPLVVINNQTAEDFRYSIYHDDVDGSRQVTRHLIELGHQKIAYLGNSLSGRTTSDRLDGFRQEMKASGLSVPDYFIYDVRGSEPEKGEQVVDHFINLTDRPTALVCFNDMIAIGTLKSLQQHGIPVPDEFSITGFDNIVFSNYTNPPLTTFDQPKKSIGQKAAELILDLLDTTTRVHKPEQKIQVLKGKLLVRQSTAPPSTGNH